MTSRSQTGLFQDWNALGWAAALAIALAAPFFASGYHLFQYSQVLILAIALVGLNLLTGVNGQISLGHGAFFGVGAYIAAILIVKFGWPSWTAVPAAGLACFAFGFLFGFPALRLGSVYLALATFALAVATPQILRYKGFDALTGGSQGLQIAKLHAPFGLPLNGDQWLYFVCLASAAALFLAARNLIRGRVGRALVALRDHPIAAEAMGVNAALDKTSCFGVSALYAGVAGGLSANVVGYVSPESYTLYFSLDLLVGVIVGGLGSIGGAIFGGFFIEFVPNIADQLSTVFGESAKALPGAVYGLLLILVMALMPSGAAGAVERLGRALTTSLTKGGKP